MCEKVKKLNEKLNGMEDDVIISSMDAKNLYPSLEKEDVSKICFEMMKDAPMEFESVDWKEVAKNLRVKLSKKEIDKHQIEKYLPVRYTQ